MVTTAQEEYVELIKILKELAIEGGFTLAVITDQNGLPIASSDVDQEVSETQAAVVAQIQNVVVRALKHLSMSAPDEVSFNDINGRKMVCRQFSCGDNSELYLAVLLPGRVRSYRKLTNKAIRSIQEVWKL